MTATYEIYSGVDGLGDRIINGPWHIASVATEREAANHIATNPIHYAVAPNGDILQWDGEAVVREPAE
ncbi:MAG: hypothetical protein ABSC05_35750 [Candidatus Solibacter sp.]|jgi:hypothetical protein